MHLICIAIPMNLLMWGCRSCALKESLAKSTDVFLYSSTWITLKMTMLDIKNEHTKSETIRKTFFNIPNTRKMVEVHQLLFLGKILYNSDDQIPSKLLTSWVYNKRRPRWVRKIAIRNCRKHNATSSKRC